MPFSRSARGDPIIITELITQERVSFTCATPSEYISWVTYGNKESLKRSAWQVALSGGEAMSKVLCKSSTPLANPIFNSTMAMVLQKQPVAQLKQRSIMVIHKHLRVAFRSVSLRQTSRYTS